MFQKIRKSKSIFAYLFTAMSLLLLISILILAGSLLVGGVYKKLDQNARDIIDQKVINRSSYLQNEMVGNWSNLSATAARINAAAERLALEGSIQFETLDRNSETALPLIMKTVDELIAVMRDKKVTGAYLIFNTHDLDQKVEDKPGIYLRDIDPLSRESEANADILIERAPVEVVKSLNIATDSSWRPCFKFAQENVDYYDFFYTPYQQAALNEKEYSAADMGYWGGKYRMDGTNYDTFTYSIPLINKQGLVYGVLGIDITVNYLNRLLPGQELLDDEHSGYMLAICQEEGLFRQVAVNGGVYDRGAEQIELVRTGKDFYLLDQRKRWYASVQYLNIYNNNTPYSNQRWSLIGIADTEELYEFSDKVRSILRAGILLTFAVGILGSYVFSYLIFRPIRRLTEEVIRTKMKEQVTFSRTHIKEIDRFARTMERLNWNIRDTAEKFTKLLQMASVKLAGFEYNEKTRELFLSDNFFEIFLEENAGPKELTVEEFREKMTAYEAYEISCDYEKRQYLFQLPEGESSVYVSLRLVKNGDVYTGVAEDVTNTVIEKKVIEYERDHDPLTGLLNRGAFIRKVSGLFENCKEELKTGALLMLDLDNLKYLNDNYGHESGDTYIAKAGQTFQENVPPQAIVSRISGDEFFIFFYGYDSEKEILEHIHALKCAIRQASIFLADQEFRLEVSGGISWYPKDSDSFEKLQHFADYAMYKIKHTSKGGITDFDSKEYLQDSFQREMKEELKTIIANKTLQFYFQPIISSRSGEIFGYEALMRSFMPSLKTPGEILKTAKEENCLGAIEELTWELALDAFVKHRKQHVISVDTRVFINSIPNQILSEEKIRELEQKYPDDLKNIVLEVTEEESVDENHQAQKARLMKFWKAAMALDDYGSGYNGERMLLLTAPEFIKIDMALIRNIDSNPDKCKIVENIVDYAHERGKKVIAEGIETIEELKQVIRLHVDYLQGYLFSKPKYLPPKIQEEMVQMIQLLNDNEAH